MRTGPIQEREDIRDPLVNGFLMECQNGNGVKSVVKEGFTPHQRWAGTCDFATMRIPARDTPSPPLLTDNAQDFTKYFPDLVLIVPPKSVTITVAATLPAFGTTGQIETAKE